MGKRFANLLAAVVCLMPAFFPLPVQGHMEDPRIFSADVDGDGLPDQVEMGGWYNASGGPYGTGYNDVDSDDDGLTDGEEKLYDTNPLDSDSPGLFVVYQENYQTQEYSHWSRYGGRSIALPTPLGSGIVVVRRGTTFSVGGPPTAELTIEKSKSYLTTLTVEQDQCAGGWSIYVPTSGTVGIYTIRLREGGTTIGTLKLYVIFELPDNMSDDFVSAYVYVEGPENRKGDYTRSDVSIVYAEGDDGGNPPREYTHDYYSWIPAGEWVNHGWGWDFKNQLYRDWMLKDHVMNAINGRTSTWSAANALASYADEVTCTYWPRYLTSSWQVLHPSSYPPYNNINQCTNVSGLLAAFSRAAGIPARPVFTDWLHSSFDHAVEVWTRPSGGSWDWYVMRAYRVGELYASGGCPDPGYKGGYRGLQDPRGFYHGQGVYAAGEDWPWSDVTHFSAYWDAFRQNSWDNRSIVKRYWWETRFVDYWGRSSEPTVVGTPPNDWPTQVPAPPNANFVGTPISGPTPLQVSFSDESSGHIRSWLWNFGDLASGHANTSTLESPTYEYSLPGDFTVTLIVTGAGGTDTRTRTGYIHAELPLVAEFEADPTTGTVPLKVQFTDRSTGTVTSRSWDFGDGGTSTAQDPSHTYVTTGTFDVSLTVTGPGGSDTEAKTGYISVDERPGGEDTSSAIMVARPLLKTMDFVDYSAGDLGEDDTNPVIQFGQVLSDYGVDLDGDGRFDQLVCKVEVDVAQSGNYWIRGELADGFAQALEHAHLEEGSHAVELRFDGMDIYMNRVDGPYVLAGLWATDAENPDPAEFAENELGYARPGYETSPYRFSDFGVAGATLSGDYRHYTVDGDGDGYVDALTVETDLNIDRADTYTVRGVLHDGRDEMVSQASWSGSGPSVVLQFDGLRDTTGPYALYLHVRNGDGKVTDGVKEPYVLDGIPEFGAKPVLLGVRADVSGDAQGLAPNYVIIDDAYSDVGVDTDGDGRFDQLVVNVAMEVEAGEGGQAYRIEGWLVDQNNSLVAWTMSDSQVLDEGVQSLSLRFDGRIINEHGVDGPFTLVALKAIPGDTYEVLDEVELAHTTSAYSYDQFEEAVTAPTAATFYTDDMEDVALYAEDFEAGTLDGAWTTSSSTGDGRIRVMSGYGTAGGTYALLMDDATSDSTYTLNEAIWTVDLSDQPQAFMVFGHAEWGDEEDVFDGDFDGNYNADGIAISDDGIHWHPIFNAPGQTEGVWLQYTIDLVAEATAAGMTLGPNFRIKFQQYDNYPLDSDGRGWDEIAILGNQWTSEPPWERSSAVWYSYSHSWGVDVSGSQSGSLTTLVDAIGYADPVLRLRTCYSTQSPSDVGYLEISTNGGADWTWLATYAGSTPHWSTEFLDLSSFDGVTELRLRFRANSQAGLRWYVDDLRLIGWLDNDTDGLSNLDEGGAGTDPNNPDTDGDGILDGREADYGTDPVDPDSDDDGIPDGWEVDNGLDPLRDDANEDPDDDGLTNSEERQNDTDPLDGDSDDDGLTDGEEVKTHGTDPNDADCDDDGLTDGEEVKTHGTDPHRADCDGDGLTDGEEVNIHGTDPLDPDMDRDGLTDREEVEDYGTDPDDPDSDDDGIPDGWEVNNGLDPLRDDANEDPDDDGLTNSEEYQNNTDPLDGDSDDDGLTDGEEVNTHGTDPKDADSDNDGLVDGDEVNTHGTDPNDADCDDDGMLDGCEVNHGLDPWDDSDADDDPDGDGLTNREECELGTDPHNGDTDGDGIPDPEDPHPTAYDYFIYLPQVFG